MSAVYSSQIWAAHSLGPGLFPGPTVPDGELWVVKSVSISYGVNIVSGRAVLSGAGAAILETGSGFGIDYPGSANVYGTFPLNPGDELVLECDAWTVDLWVGGFKFLTA